MISPYLNIKGVRLMRKTLLFIAILLVSWGIVQNALSATKTRSAVSPYIQTDNDSTYTFVGVTHPSLNTAATQIGLTVATIGLDGATPSTTFTVNAGETYRIFIVSTNHSTINSDTVTGARVIFLSTTTGGSAAGHLLMTANTANPRARGVNANDIAPKKSMALNQLSLWGAIVVPSTSTGFAMEFIGDSHDSTAILETNSEDNPTYISRGRGIN